MITVFKYLKVVIKGSVALHSTEVTRMNQFNLQKRRSRCNIRKN